MQGSFYEQELQKTNFKKDDDYIIEKVLKTKNDKVYVKWRNYHSSFNSWANLDDIKKTFMKKLCIYSSDIMTHNILILSSKMTYICYV